MHRYLQCEMNSKYFKLFGESFLKSFYTHNKYWELFVADLGLTASEVKLLSRYGTVKKYPEDIGRRWNSLTARIFSLGDLLHDDNIVIRCDIDSLIFGSYDELVAKFMADPALVMAPKLGHSLAGRARNLMVAANIFNVKTDDVCLTTPSFTACFMLLKGAKELTDMFSWLKTNWYSLLAAAKEEEPILSATLYNRKIKNREISWKYFWSIETRWASHFWYTIPSTEPVNSIGERIFAAHFALGKYFMLNVAAGPGHENWGGWQELIDKYKEMPWPESGVADGHI